MRLLYVALDQTVPGTLGGSVHVQSVAEGLAALGHDVHVRDAGRRRVAGGPRHVASRWRRRSAARSCAGCAPAPSPTLAREIGADVIMERYYNFGGEGVFAARGLGLPAVLEVNAPIIDYPGSREAPARSRAARRADAALARSALPATRSVRHAVGRRSCRPGSIAGRCSRSNGAPTSTASGPDAPGPMPVHAAIRRASCACLPARFAPGTAPCTCRRRSRACIAAGDTRFGGVFIGDGPERARGRAGRARRAGRDLHRGAAARAAAGGARRGGHRRGAVRSGRHAPLRLGFYWSPLKVFEYMAVGLPVVAPALPRLRKLVEDGAKGVLYDPDDPRGLDRALASLADPERRRRLGAAARARVVRDFSWAAHCAALDRRLRALRRSQ